MGPVRAWLIAAAALLSPTLALAQAPVTSAGPDAVAVTIYRAPDRSPQDKLELGWLQGFALVTEKRRVAIPAGRAVVRFEGVAGRILPESAIITGLPDGVREKNLDAELLSGATLYARSLGRPVTIRRTLNGKVVEESAIIRSGPEGAAIIQTRDGFTAANCGPSADTLLYDGVPAGLSAKPTLSVETESTAAREVELTLSYLAWGFDWQANYVATMRPDGRSADLFAWLTLANGDVTGFPEAETMVVAGKIESGDEPERLETGAGDVSFRCYPSPMPFVDAIVAEDIGEMPAPLPAPAMAMSDQDIVVTGHRVNRMAVQEELGDLKLYRVPDRTTVAAMSQKQVALLDRKAVRVAVLHRNRISNDYLGGDPRLLLRAQNKQAEGLGLPLPAGPVAVFEPRGAERLLVGEGFTGDKAVNEEVEVELAASTQVRATLKELEAGTDEKGRDWQLLELSITNANPFPIRYEAEIAVDPERRLEKPSARLGRKNGRDLWSLEVPANGSRKLRYRLQEID
jgi:hypothetical protein